MANEDKRDPEKKPVGPAGRGRGIPPTIDLSDKLLTRQIRQMRAMSNDPSFSGSSPRPSGSGGDQTQQGTSSALAPPEVIPILEVGESSSSGSSSPSSGEKTVRGRGGFKATELHTIPENIIKVRTEPNASGQKVTVLTNFVSIQPIKNALIYQYRIDFKPKVESVSLRRNLFNSVAREIFPTKCIFDGVGDARSGTKLEFDVTKTCDDIVNKGNNIQLTIRRVGTITGSFEMVRLYNMHMKEFLRKSLGFFQVNQTGAFVHHTLSTPIGETNLMAFGGYKTSANVHENNNVLMNMESVHKLCQKDNLYQYMNSIRNNNRDKVQEAINERLIGKLVVTSYNKNVYKIEEVIYNKNPMTKFYHQKKGKEITFQEFYKSVYNLDIRDLKQPLLLVVPNNKRKRDTVDVAGGQEPEKDILLVPELCNIAGLTDEQRNDNRLKNELVRASQVPPSKRVENLNNFLKMFHSSADIKKTLSDWGYSYGKEPLQVSARILPVEKIGVGQVAQSGTNVWPLVDQNTGGFDNIILREKCAIIPKLPFLRIIIGRSDREKEGAVLGRIKSGFTKVGLDPINVEIIRMEGPDTAQNFSNTIKKLPPDTTMAIVLLPGQNKERYDAIKKMAATERGLITQVITTRLLMDERKANGASVKIGIQVCAKLGGEPWWVPIPLRGAMVCGYDTYHDTAQRGRSFGAFVASMNAKYSQWWSKADVHDKIDELSSHVTENFVAAMEKYKEKNKTYPERIFIYRDGVGDGQLEHVLNVELKQIKAAIDKIDDSLKFCYIVVNKRIGARFYWKNGPNYLNCPPGTVIDDVVTRKERYDFYLISQSTRQGTVAPTYYNIIFDESALDPEKHQMLAYKLCFLYYNWSGTVRVPAPCQYAHKLALLCGEHLHKTPTVSLDNKLHYL